MRIRDLEAKASPFQLDINVSPHKDSKNTAELLHSHILALQPTTTSPATFSLSPEVWIRQPMDRDTRHFQNHRQ